MTLCGGGFFILISAIAISMKYRTTASPSSSPIREPAIKPFQEIANLQVVPPMFPRVSTNSVGRPFSKREQEIVRVLLPGTLTSFALLFSTSP